MPEPRRACAQHPDAELVDGRYCATCGGDVDWDRVMRGNLEESGVTRLTVNIGPRSAAALNLVAAREGVTITEALRRLVSYGDLIYRADKLDGKDVLLFKDGEYQTVIIPAGGQQ